MKKCSNCKKEIKGDYYLSWKSNPPFVYCANCQTVGYDPLADMDYYKKTDEYKVAQFQGRVKK